MNEKPIKGDIREDGKRFDGYTWREVGLNHHMNEDGLIYYKREYRTLKGYLKTGGNINKIKHNIPDLSKLGKVVTLLYDQHKQGSLYVITNPAWIEWIKIGRAVDPIDRCKGYQTSSPLRDFELEYYVPVNDRRKAEARALSLAEEVAKERNGEWFNMPIILAKEILDRVKEEEDETST